MIISLDEFLVNKLQRCVGARLRMDLYTMVVVSPFVVSLMEGRCNLGSCGEAKASQLLFVTILNA